MVTFKIFLNRLRRWSSRYSWALVVGIVLIFSDLVGLPSSPVLFVLGIGSAGYGVFEIALRVSQDVRTLRRMYGQERLGGPIVKPYEHPYDDWQEFELKQWHAVNNPSLDARLASGRIIQIDRNEQMWKPKGQHVEELRRLLSLRLDSDEHKIRLSSDLLPSTDMVQVQRTAYSAFLVTNRLGPYEIRERGNSRELIDADQVILRAGRLPTLARSKCSNHLGVDVLAFTTDGRIIVTVQSNKNQLSPDLLAPSGSGSVDWDDLRGHEDLIGALAGAMRREMSEELGLPPSEVPDLRAVRVLGYARMSHLGGKPQFFGVIRLNLVHEQVRGIERRYIHDYREICFDPEQGIDDAVKAIRAFDHRYRSQMSFPLYINLQIVLRWLTGNANAADWLVLQP
jgi:8-oxo-dGTP pyrophosphatase MutT (NUDIX family)